jgi:tripartite-type tricarboxylate transporter receptor subunit TctC
MALRRQRRRGRIAKRPANCGLSRALAALALSVIAYPATAQTAYPVKPVRLLVGFSPGGGQDIAARILAKHLAAAWGQSVIVENRAGANGMIATEAVANAAPDGYTLHMFTANDTVNASAIAKIPFDTLRDLAPVTAVSSSPYLLGVHPALQVKNTREFIALAKSRPGQLRYASSGTGSPIHLSTALFNRMAGVNMTHIPYKGIGPALVDLISGQVQVTMASLASFMQHYKSGRVKLLAVTGTSRSAQLPEMPEMPTIAESGVPGYEATTWNGIMVPGKTPPAIITALNRELLRLLALPEVRDTFLNMGTEPRGSTPEAFGNQVRAEIAKWGGVVKAIGLQAE